MALDGGTRVAGDVGAQFVGATTGCGRDVGLGTRFEFGDLGGETSTTVGEQRCGLGVGLGEQASPFGVDVARA